MKTLYNEQLEKSKIMENIKICVSDDVVRNDFIGTLIFEKNENIIPTFGHHRGLDFFIDGISYDQKVARSVTNEFKK